MKKIILSILFIASANSSLLLAQNGNRLKAGGWKLEEKNNQKTDNRKTASLLENQINQEVEPTTNYELPTTNCSNQGYNLDCYPMMDPLAIEEGIVSLEGTLGFSVRKSAVAELERQAIQAENQTLTAETKIRACPIEERAPLWDEAIQQASEVENAWDVTVEIVKNGEGKVPLELKDEWCAKLENAEQLKNIWAVKTSVRKTYKAADIAQILMDQCQVDPEILEGKVTPLLNETLQKADEVDTASTQTIEIIKAWCDEAPLQFKSCWKCELETAKVIKNQCLLASHILKATQVAIAVSSAKNRAEAATDIEAFALWDEAIQKAGESEKHYADALEIQKAFPSETNQALENCKDRSFYLKYICKAKKASLIAKVAKNRTHGAEGSEALDLWDDAIQKGNDVVQAWNKIIEIFLNKDTFSGDDSFLKTALEDAEILKAKWVGRTNRYKAHKVGCMVSLAVKAAKAARHDEAILLWEDVIQKAEAAEITWGEVLELLGSKDDQASLRLTSWWEASIKNASQEKDHAGFLLALYKIRKLNAISFVVADKAHKSSSNNEAFALWDEAIQTAEEAEKAWAQLLERSRDLEAQSPSPFSSMWRNKIEGAEGMNECSALICMYKSIKAEFILLEALEDRANVASDTEMTFLYDEIIQKEEEAGTAWAQTAEAFRVCCHGAPLESNATWMEKIEAAEKSKIQHAAAIAEWEMKKNNLASKKRKVTVQSPPPSEVNSEL
ncbi:MAG TPA: hypothetical protein VJK54_05000 [Chthoniobacterales bacterium]|nr:hypothetical protein [Chthoniobacterales bacterium]